MERRGTAVQTDYGNKNKGLQGKREIRGREKGENKRLAGVASMRQKGNRKRTKTQEYQMEKRNQKCTSCLKQS